MLPDVTPSSTVLLGPSSTLCNVSMFSTLSSIGRVGANEEEAGRAPETEPSEPRVRHCRGADRRQWVVVRLRVVTPNTGMTCLLFTRDSRLIALGSRLIVYVSYQHALIYTACLFQDGRG